MATDPQRREFRRAKRIAVLSAILAVVATIVVVALPGPIPRRYPDRIPVRFWHMWTAEWKDVVDDIVDRFNESQEKYEVIALSVPDATATSKFLLAVAGGDPPDVMAQWFPVIPKWAENGLLLELDTLMSPEEWAEFKCTAYPAAQKIGIYKEHLYGVTTGLNAFACYIRLDYLREAGLDIRDFPETLEGLMEWAGKLHRIDGEGNIRRIGFLPQWFHYYVAGFGDGFYDWDAGKVLLNTPANLRALQFIADQHRKLGYENVIRFTSGLAIGLGNIEWPFITGAYAITLDGQWRVEQIAKYAPKLEYATRPLPPPAGGRPNFGYTNGNFMVIPACAKQVEGAWEFIKFWSGLENPERAAEFYTWGGWLPLRPEIAEAPIYQKYLKEHPQFKTFLDLMPSENMQPVPPVPYQVYLWDRVLFADDSATRGTVSPRAALERLEQEVAREVASRREFGYEE